MVTKDKLDKVSEKWHSKISYTPKYKSISKPTEKAKVTFRKTDFLGRVEI